MNSDSISVDFVLLPSSKLATTSYVKSQELAQLGSMYTLKPGEYYPHCTLYMTQLSVDSVNDARVVIQEVAQLFNPVHATAKSLLQNRGYLGVNYERNNAIDKLQVAVIESINPMRAVGDQFSPHITLTRFDDDTDRASYITLTDFDGEFESIGLFELGENGTCIRKIFEIPLGG
jgi:hypothetical protein